MNVLPSRERAILDALPDMVVVVDTGGLVSFANTAAGRFFGHTAAEMQGTHLEVFATGDTASSAWSMPAGEVRNPGHSANAEVHACDHTGSWKWLAVTVTSCLVEPGVQGIVYRARDITDQRATEAKLRDSEERMRLALESANVGAWDWYPQTDEVNWSSSLSTLMGLSNEPRTWTAAAYRDTIVHPEDRVRTTELAPRIHTLSADTPLDYRVVRPDGEVRYMRDLGHIVEETADGTPLRCAGVTFDITTLTQTSEALLLRNRAIAAASSGIVIVDATAPDQPIIDVNPAFESITGYTAEEALGRNCRFLQGPDTDSTVISAMRQAIADQRELTVRILNYRKDGTAFWNAVHLAPVRNERGDVTHIVGIQHDITDQVVAEEEQRLHSIVLDQAFAAVIATDAHGQVTHWNRHAQNVYGWSSAEAIRKTVRALKVGASDPLIRQEIKRHMRAGLRWEGEYPSCTKDGSPIHVHVAISPVMGPTGDLLATVGVSVDLTERKRLEDRLTHLAYRDSITGLPNRVRFTEELDAIAADRSPHPQSMVLLIDLDRFKTVNDSLGHTAGDELLFQVAKRLSNVLRPQDLFARIGGDEFAVLLREASAEAAQRVANRLLSALDQPFTLRDQHVFIGASIGIAAIEDGSDASIRALRDADVALYEAKGGGKGQCAMFTSESGKKAAEKLKLETELRDAIRRDELELWFQAIVRLSDGGIHGFEALVRWRHPELGLILPARFIPLAEETGLIVPLGEWVLQEACRQATEWSEHFPEVSFAISVNVSPQQFRGGRFLNLLWKILGETRLPPSRLKIEVTEQALAADEQVATEFLRGVKALGVRIALDDFGTGYSSLGRLRTLPLDVLKIDRSFISTLREDSSSMPIVRAIVALGHELGMAVTAEGIETEEQRRLLVELGCDRGQGYLFAKPVPAMDVASLLLRQRVTAYRPSQIVMSAR